MMFIKIKNINFKHENESTEPNEAEVSYNLVLNDSQLDGNIIIKNSEMNNNIMNSPLWEFSRYIHKKVMESM